MILKGEGVLTHKKDEEFPNGKRQSRPTSEAILTVAEGVRSAWSVVAGRSRAAGVKDPSFILDISGDSSLANGCKLAYLSMFVHTPPCIYFTIYIYLFFCITSVLLVVA